MKNKILLIFTSLVLLLIALNLCRATVPQTQTVLKSYFQSNSIPTQAQYAELIDTMFWYANQTYSNSVSAASSSSALNAQYATVPTPSVSGKFNQYNSPAALTNWTYGGSGSGYSVTCNFSTPFPNTNYIVIGKYNSNTVYGVPVLLFATNKVVLDYGTIGSGRPLTFAIYTNPITSQIFHASGFQMYP